MCWVLGSLPCPCYSCYLQQQSHTYHIYPPHTTIVAFQTSKLGCTNFNFWVGNKHSTSDSMSLSCLLNYFSISTVSVFRALLVGITSVPPALFPCPTFSVASKEKMLFHRIKVISWLRLLSSSGVSRLTFFFRVRIK